MTSLGPSARLRWLLLALLLCACAEEGADPPRASVPDEAETSTVEAVAPVAPEPGAAEPAPTPSPPLVDLLHATPTTLTVSSAYQDQSAQIARLVDGDLESAWNSRTGDLMGAWIEVDVPAGATVHEIALTVGFTHVQRGNDLFTGNHRVAEVRVSHDDVVLGTHPLDVESRDLQRVPAAGGGGRYRLTVTRVVEGARAEWRETCISELQVWGEAPGAEAGAQTPTLRVAASDESGSDAPANDEPVLAPTEPAPAAVADAAYFAVGGRGLVRLSAQGVETLFEGPVVDFAVDGEGRVFVLGSGGGSPIDIGRRLFVVADGQRRELAVPDQETFHSIAVDAHGAPVLAGAFGIWRRQGRGWSPGDVMDDAEDEFAAQQPQEAVVAADGVIWARGQHTIFQGRGGRYREERIPLFGDTNAVDLAVAGGVVAVVSNLNLCVHRSYWRCTPPGWRRVTVGPDGTVAAGGYDRAIVAPPTGDPVSVALADAGIVTDVARDTRGRTWITSTGGLSVLGPDHAVARRWARGAVPGLGGHADRIVVAGLGPELPPAP